MMRMIKNFKNIQRPIARTIKLYIQHCHNGNDKEYNVEGQNVYDYPQESNKEVIEWQKSNKELIEWSKSNKKQSECQLVAEKKKEKKCHKYNKYSFYDYFVRTISYIETQPSNKKYFQPKGLIDKEIQVKEDKTKNKV